MNKIIVNKKKGSYDFSCLIEAALINYGVTCNASIFSDKATYLSFDFGGWEDLTVEKFYKNIIKNIKVPYIVAEFKRSVVLE